MNPRTLLPLTSLVLLHVLAPHPAEAARRVLVIEGRALDQEGIPVAGVKIEASGSHQASASTDRSGEFSLALALPYARELARAPLAITVRARRPGWRFAVAGGESDLGLDVRVERDAAGIERCVSRSNDARVAAGAARIVSLDGDATTVVAVNFRGQRGEAPPPTAPELREVAKVALSGGMPIVETSRAGAPAAVAPPVAAPKADAPARPDTSRRRPESVAAAVEIARSRSSSRVIPPAPKGGRERSAPLVIRQPPWPFPPEASADSCACRIEGTVEVASAKPLPSRVPLTVSLEGLPQHADSVELFMGSPRRFLLARVPCGRYAIRLDIRSTLEFDVSSRDTLGAIGCEPGRIRQVRIVLKPR